MENAVVIHKMYGRGIVTVQKEKTIRIRFEREGVGEKNFVYPDAFRSFLHFEEPQYTERVKGELDKICREEEARIREQAAQRAAYLEAQKQHRKERAAAKRKSAAKRMVRSTRKKASDTDAESEE